MPPKSTGHTAGIYADMTLDGPEIGTLVVVVDKARNLPNRRSMGKQDPYCAMRLGKEAKKTGTDVRGGQTPRWDQELRFTVHESPDYYKLKVSVFNDDKKSELIGEGWIDLGGVIVPGGGQSDQWNELQFKNRYAGEIRIELTYYDIRPREESVVEKRKESERAANGSRNNTPSKTGEVGGPRQLGPREIKRRPLPADPTGSSPAQHPVPAPAPIPAPVPRPLPMDPTASAPIPLSRPVLPDHPHSSPGPYAAQQYPSKSAPYRDSWQPPAQPREYVNPSTPTKPLSHDPYDFAVPPRGHAPDPMEPALPDGAYGDLPQYDQMKDYREPEDPGYSSTRPSYQPQPLPPAPIAHGISERRHSAQPDFPSQDRNYINSSPYGSSPPVQERQASLPSPGGNYQRVSYNRYNVSPVKNDPYRDSPLRQSMSHSQHDLALPEPPLSYEDEGSAAPPPPPPPVHRYANTRPVAQPLPPTETQSVTMPEPLQIGQAKKYSMDDRSPLQNLERQYDPRIQPQPSPVSPINIPDPYLTQEPSDPYYTRQPRHRIYTEEPPSNDDGHYSPGAYGDFTTPSPPHPRQPVPITGAQEFRRSPSPMVPDRDREIYGPGGRNGHAAYEPPHSVEPQRGMITNAAGVPLSRPRAISPSARSTMRKSVSPGPPSRSDARNPPGVPFSPDSYDVFNPSSVSASSVAGTEERYETPEQAMAAARQREVEKLREQGPIIGNDGRVIDPSDHLPTDTWAPEPQRKKKPEVVVRFKTGNSSTPRTPNGNGSSPIPPRPHSMSTPAYGGMAVPTPIYSSPGGPSPPRTGRNRLQKAGPHPPHQPHPAYQQTYSSPAVPMSSHHTPSPKFDLPVRHSVSEYPLRENQNYGNAYSPSTRPPPSARGPPPIPAKIPLQQQQPSYSTSGYDSYGGYGRMDALAAELSNIDIGAVDGGRYRAPRTRRNY